MSKKKNKEVVMDDKENQDQPSETPEAVVLSQEDIDSIVGEVANNIASREAEASAAADREQQVGTAVLTEPETPPPSDSVEAISESLAKTPEERRNLVEMLSDAPDEVKVAILQLHQRIAELESGQGSTSRRVKSGSRARPNVMYTLMKKPVNWTGAPQVRQLVEILFDPDVVKKYKDPKTNEVKIPEPELFDIIKNGHENGVLKTKQPPIRIFQYYRSDLLDINALRWK